MHTKVNVQSVVLYREINKLEIPSKRIFTKHVVWELYTDTQLKTTLSDELALYICCSHVMEQVREISR